MSRKTFSADLDSTAIDRYIQRFGNSTSLGLLHPSGKIFKNCSIDGIIGYRDDGHCAVTIGDPICSLNDRLALFEKFNEFCKEQNKKVVCSATSESFTNDIVNYYGWSALQFGDEIIIDPRIDTRTLTGSYPHHLRQKYKQGIAQHIKVSEYEGHCHTIEQTLVTIAHEWLSNRRGIQVYLLPLDIFAHRSTKRWFYAHKDNKIIGFLMLNRLDAYGGWVLNGSIMLILGAPTCTSEFLMLHTLEVLRNEGYRYLSIGAIPSSEIGRMENFGKISQHFINYTMKVARTLFKMHDRQRYWKKFQPDKKPAFLLFACPWISWKEIRSILRALNVKI